MRMMTAKATALGMKMVKAAALRMMAVGVAALTMKAVWAAGYRFLIWISAPNMDVGSKL